MGAAASVSILESELAKPIDASDVDGVEAAKTEVTRLRKLLANEFTVGKAGETNSAFLFVKPHACNDKVIAMVKEGLAAAGITVTAEADLAAEQIDSELLIDNHYGAIAAKAVKLQPSELSVPEKGKAAFEATFGLAWDAALEQGLVFNAKDACTKLECDGAALEIKWRAATALKFGGGFYCAKFDDIFVMNGFYLSMRALYTTPPAAIHTMCVEWPAAKLSWSDFRGTVLGATDPSAAKEGSLRRNLYDTWEECGLEVQPNTGLNGVHGSASPFEALVERMNWCKVAAADDAFGQGLLAAGIDEAKLAAWSADPQVTLDGTTGSLFDALEDTNASSVLAAVRRIE